MDKIFPQTSIPSIGGVPNGTPSFDFPSIVPPTPDVTPDISNVRKAAFNAPPNISTGPVLDTKPPQLKLHPINPFEEPGKWVSEYWNQLTDPITEAASSDHWYAYPVATFNTLMTPFNLISAAATTTLGFEKSPTFLDAADQLAQANQVPWLESWALHGAGFAADIATNPLNFVSFGAGPLAQSAAKIMKEAPLIGGVKNAEQLERISRYYRTGSRITSDLVREHIAPEMLARSMRGLGEVAEGSPRPVWGAGGLTDLLFGARKEEPLFRGGTKSYKNLLEEYRGKNLQELQNYKQFPGELAKATDYTKPNEMSRLVESFAGHNAYLEKQIMEELPATRLSIPGITSWEGAHPLSALGRTAEGLTKYPIPSPTSKLSELASKSLGKWVTPELLTTPMGELGLTPQRLASAQEFLTAHRVLFGAGGVDATKLTLQDLEHTIQMIQSGVRPSQAGGVFTNRKLVWSWLSNELQAMPQQYRQAHLDNIENLYQLLYEGLSKDPKALTATSTRIYELKDALNLISQLKTSPTMAKIIAAEGKYAIGPTGPGKFALQMAMDGVGDNLATLTERLEQWEQAIRANQGAERKLGAAVTAARGVWVDSQGEAQSIVPVLQELWKGINKVKDSVTPYPYALQASGFRKNLNASLKEAQALWSSLDNTIREAFLGATGPDMDGLQLVGKLLATPDGRRLLRDMSEKVMGDLIKVGKGETAELVAHPLQGAFLTAPDQAQYITEMYDMLDKTLNSHIANMTMMPADAQAIGSYVRGLNPEKLARLMYGMQDLARAKKHASVEAALLERLTNSFRTPMARAEEILRAEHLTEYRNILEDAAKYQSYYQPHEWSKFIMNPGGIIDRLNRLQEVVLRKAGINPLMIDTLRDMETSRGGVKPAAERFAREKVINEGVHSQLKTVDPVRFASMSRADELGFTDALGQILQYEPTLTREGVTPAERVIAEGKIQEGTEFLRDNIGDPNVDSFVSTFRTKMRQHLDEMYRAEQKLGMAGIYRENYVPYVLTGSDWDVQTFRELMGRKMGGVVGSKADKLRVTRTFGPAEERHFPDAAAVQNYINEVNANYALEHGLSKPLNVHVEDNIAATLANRKAVQLYNVVNRDAMAKLKAVLPSHMQILWHIEDTAARESIAKKYGYKSLVDLIPSMEGYYVPEYLYNYIDTFVPDMKKEPTLMDFFTRTNNFLARLSTRFSLVHVKNLLSLGFIAGVDPKKMGKYLKLMWDEARSGKYHPDYSLLERMSLAMNDNPLYRQAVANGITHFRGAEQFRSAAQNVKASMAANATLGSRAVKWVTEGKSPITAFTFDVMDRAAKMALYEDLIEKGLPGRQAADWVNHFLIDYSARNLNPKFRQIGHAMFPFFAWRIGNTFLHVPQMIQNPSRYALMNFAREYLTDTIMSSNPYLRENMPAALSQAVALPMQYENGNTAWAFPDFPQDAYIKLMKNTIGQSTNPFEWRAEAINFMLSRSRMASALYDALSPSRRKQLTKEELWDTIVGANNRTGYANDLLWGIMPTLFKIPSNIFQTIFTDHDAWKNIPPEMMNFLLRTQEVTPQGKLVR